jgi:WhiB family transcriptional regulator, redox-sensing transcriptional regulator
MTRRPGTSDHPLTFAGRSERQQRGDEFLAARLITTGYWRSAAACLSADPELFFPISYSGRALEQVAAAKAICAACPVRRECLAFALQTGQSHGIWGGLTEQERAPRRRRLPVQSPPR